MQVYVPDKQLRDALVSQYEMSRRFGKAQASILMRLISELFASARLGDFCSLPQSRFRQLDGKRKGQIALNLLPPLEVVIAPLDEPGSEAQNSAPSWTAATHVNILDVTESLQIPISDV